MDMQETSHIGTIQFSHFLHVYTHEIITTTKIMSQSIIRKGLLIQLCDAALAPSAPTSQPVAAGSH